MTNLTWTRDEGYCCEETAHLGDFAAVIIPPNSAYNDDAETWEIQTYDEMADEYFEPINRVRGIPSKEGAKRVAATILEELAAARK